MTRTYRKEEDRTETGPRDAGLQTPGTGALPYPDDITEYRGAADAVPGDATQFLRPPANTPRATPGPGVAQTPANRGGAAARHDGRESTGHLVAEVVGDISTLFRQEVALAKAEIREEAKKAGKGAGMFAGAGGAGYFALLFVLLAVMFGLGEVMALGWAALIVGVALLGVAAVLALRGRATVRTVHPAPTQTVETLREDVQWAQSRRH
jgi:hypothetical protein